MDALLGRLFRSSHIWTCSTGSSLHFFAQWQSTFSLLLRRLLLLTRSVGTMMLSRLRRTRAPTARTLPFQLLGHTLDVCPPTFRFPQLKLRRR
jgi:hypothetical protein